MHLSYSDDYRQAGRQPGRLLDNTKTRGSITAHGIYASHNLEHEGLKQVVVPTGRRDVKPVETESSTFASLEYLNSIPYVKASSVGEAGSLTASA